MGKSVLKAGIFGKSEAEGLEEKLHQLATKQIVQEIFLRGATPTVGAAAVPEVEGQTGDAERSAGLPTRFGCFRADRPVAAIEDVGEMVPGLGRQPAKVRQRTEIAVSASTSIRCSLHLSKKEILVCHAQKSKIVHSRISPTPILWPQVYHNKGAMRKQD